MPENASVIGIVSAFPGRPLPPAIESITVDGMLAAGILTTMASAFCAVAPPQRTTTAIAMRVCKHLGNCP